MTWHVDQGGYSIQTLLQHQLHLNVLSPLPALTWLLMSRLMICLLQKISDLRSTVGGGKDEGITSPKANGVKNTPYSAVLVPTDSNSLVYARTPTEVRAITAPCMGASCKNPLMFRGETPQSACAGLAVAMCTGDATPVTHPYTNVCCHSRSENPFVFRDGTSQIACACIENIPCTGDATPMVSPDRIGHSEAIRSCRAGQEFVTCMMANRGPYRCWPLSTEAVQPSHQPSTPRASMETSMAQALHKQAGHSHC